MLEPVLWLRRNTPRPRSTNGPTVPTLNFGLRVQLLVGGGRHRSSHRSDGIRIVAAGQRGKLAGSGQVLRLGTTWPQRSIGWGPRLDLDEALAWTMRLAPRGHRRRGRRVALRCPDHRPSRAGLGVTSPPCRSCGHELRVTVVDLGLQPLSNAYLTVGEVDAEQVYPLHARYCEFCHLVQVDDVVPPEEIFSDYAYFSSIPTRGSARPAGSPSRRPIGSHSGPTASSWRWPATTATCCSTSSSGASPCSASGANRQRGGRLSVPPAQLPTSSGDSSAPRRPSPRSPSMVTPTSSSPTTCSPMSRPPNFVSGLERLLAAGREGRQSSASHLLRLIEHPQFDTIYHEHYSYFSLIAAQVALGRHGLTVFDVDQLESHGGSLRISACRTDDPAHPVRDVVSEIVGLERAAQLDQPAGFVGAKKSKRAATASRSSSFSSAIAGCPSWATAPRRRATRCSTPSMPMSACSPMWSIGTRTSRAEKPLPARVPIRGRASDRRQPASVRADPAVEPERRDRRPECDACDWDGRFVVAVPAIEVF